MESVLFSAVLLVAAACVISTVHGDCQWQQPTAERSTICYFQAIDRTSIIDLDTAVGAQQLTIDCNDELLYESVLPAQMLAKFTDLTDLTVRSCKLLHLTNGSFGGLHNLRSLTVRTGNARWGQANKLELASGVFAQLNQVQLLNMIDNNIRSLPVGWMCPLASLTHLNVSGNRIRSSHDLALRCEENMAQLKSIDMSNNEMIQFDDDWSAGTELRSLERLYLQNNNLTKLSTGIFNDLPSLKVLNLSANHLETLPAGLFANNHLLQEIYLQGSRLYQLPADLFAAQSDLLILDLSGNQLSSHYIDTQIFANLKRLVVLNLFNNALTRVDAATFEHLNFLQVLDLKNNSIGFIDDRTFGPLTNLHTLNLGGNRLHIINNQLFNGLFVLNRLVLSNNLITVIETSAFVNCSTLKELDLSSNQMSDIPLAITALGQLKSLDLGENRISTMRNDSFRNLQQLTGLRLMDNLISNITVGCLFDLPRLNWLNLARNKITRIERGAFERNQVIEAIRLDNNLLSDVDGVFATLNSLHWLNLSENQLIWFDYAFIPMNLKYLDIHGNYIEELGNYYKLQAEISVTTLDASHNRITDLAPLSVPNSIEMFFINNNLIRNIYPNTFVDKINLTRVDLYTNALAKLHLHSIRIAAMRMKKRLPEFYLGSNPFECDCSMSWLRHRSGGESAVATHNHPKIMDYESIECLVAHKREQPVRLLSSLTHADFLCRFDTQCPVSCHCCEFKSCHCQTKCPDGCSCFHDQSGSIVEINCGKQNAPALPERIPLESTKVYVDGNNYAELKNYAFSSLKKIKHLFLNGSNLVSLQPNALTGLVSLQKLYLQNNKLSTLSGNEFKQVYNLRELYLHDNEITFIENGTFAGLLHLQMLRLDGNRLTQMTSYQMQLLSTIKSIAIARNSWTCNCEFLIEFIPMVYAGDARVIDASDLVCGGNNDQPIHINMTASLLCSDSNYISDSGNRFAASSLPDGIPHGYVPLLGFALIIIVVLAVLVAVFTVKEQMCCVYATAGSNDEKSYSKMLYDALVLTAREENDFVAQSIVAELQQSKPSLRFGVQHRNVSSANVMASANRSRKIVIYVSNAFLQTEWQRPEIRNAIANSWIPGKVILIQTPNLHWTSNSDRELINNVGPGIVLLKTWEIDFALKLAYALETHPSHYVDQQIWKSNGSRMIQPYAYTEYHQEDQLVGKNDSYYSSATAESVLSHSPTTTTFVPTANPPVVANSNSMHVYAGIDSDYGSVTNEDSMVSVHRPILVENTAIEVDSTTSMLGSDREANGYLV